MSDFSGRIHLCKDFRQLLTQLNREALAYLIQTVAGNSVELRDDISVLSLDRARDERRVVLGADLWLDSAERLLERGGLPLALLEVFVWGRSGGFRLLTEGALQLGEAFAGPQPVVDSPMDESGQIRPEPTLRAVVLECRQVAREICEDGLHDVVRIGVV